MRPSLHFTAQRGWINDPHGLTFHNDTYHLFHQYVPDSMVWAPNCHWGHATSPDLVNWTHHDVALAPGDGDDGIWTGCLVKDGAETRVLYTSVAEPNLGLGRVRVATPNDETWDSWTKGDMVVRAPEDMDLIAYRDPFVARDGSGWRMYIGAATRDGQALALTYTSDDLQAWAYDGVALSRSTHETDPVWMGALWECPQIFEVDGHWVMVSSVWDDDVLHYVGYGIGGADSQADGRFTPADWGQLSFGESYYAPSFFRDREQRPCLMFWMRGVSDVDQGWASCLSVPYLLSARDGRIVADPHPEIAGRRTTRLGAREAASAFDLEWLPAPAGDQLVLAADAGKTACLTVTDGAVTLERPGRDVWSMPWSGEKLRVLVDGSVIEVSSTVGVLGGAIEPSTTWHSVVGECTAWSLGE
ncbi:glycoside hydrolase family 32 protein [Aeromicrobium ginsengisoli]|uniref:beta-fructofuranosidase n=1 Tax=Aeromicrobium ginsengisoli TaxID=363867 RepID=A0A5M4FEG6_9ACTN|nr:glycoside hydrolase family 32 protein [Aeromicrobium ginsengisoli]KAA1397737.1 glycoside hydrolase family 32 protein [Aeromicrobium ginsengisoli]